MRALGLTLAITFVVVASGTAQQLPAPFLNDAGAGIYQGDPSSRNGPVLYARQMRPFGSFLLLGAREEYRDDDNSGGRVQLVSAGFEAALALNVAATTLYVPAGLAIDVLHVSHLESYRYYGYGYADAHSGVRLRASTGLGLALPAGRAQLVLEARGSLDSDKMWWGGTFGIRTRPGQSAHTGSVRLLANTLYPVTSEYAREPDYQGYSFVYQWAVSNHSFDALRATIGVDFLDFTYSTGAISTLMGLDFNLINGLNGHFSLDAVPQAGLMWYAEGSTKAHPTGTMGLESTLGFESMAVTVGIHGLIATGPVGVLVGAQQRIGLAVRL